MQKKTLGLYLFILIGVLVATFFLIIGWESQHIPFLVLGIFTLVLSLSIFFQQEWARFAALVLSVLTILISISLLAATFFIDRSIVMGLCFLSPLTLWSLIGLFCLTRRNVKTLFKPSSRKAYFIPLTVLMAVILGMFFYSRMTRTVWFGQPVYSPDGQYLLFHAEYKKGRMVYRLCTDGTNLTRLTSGKEDSSTPAYSPDGSQIVFARTPIGKYGEQSDLYLMNADGSNIRSITSGPANDFDPVFSPDGATIYFIRAEWYGHHSPMVPSRWHDQNVWSVRVDGSDLKKITHGQYYNMSRASISPDGKTLLVHIYEGEPSSLWLISLENPKEMRPVRPNLRTYLDEGIVRTPREGYMTYNRLYDPQFSPDGKSILFQWAPDINQQGKFAYDLFTIDLGNMSVKKVTNFMGSISSPSFSPDGKEIVLLRNSGKGRGNELWVVDSDGRNARKINIDRKKL